MIDQEGGDGNGGGDGIEAGAPAPPSPPSRRISGLGDKGGIRRVFFRRKTGTGT